MHILYFYFPTKSFSLYTVSNIFVHNSVNISNTCNGFQNLLPTTVEIFSDNCVNHGYKDLISEHECASAVGEKIIRVDQANQPPGCFYRNDYNQFYFNAHMNPYEPIGGGYAKGICKQ